MQHHCIVFGDIHGDFDLLVDLMTRVARVALYEENNWLWTAKDITVVCCGDFIDRYRVENEYVVSTEKAMESESNIIHAFMELQRQAKLASNCQFVVCLGNHELGNLLQMKDYYEFGVRNASNEVEISRRAEFLRETLLPFAMQCPLIVRWGNYMMCHGGLEYTWFERHQIESIEDVNNRFWQAIRERDIRVLFRFMENDSPLMSRKMSLRPDVWHMEDKSRLSFLLAPQLYTPKFVVGHTTFEQIQDEGMGNYHTPRCEESDNVSTILSTSSNMGDDAYYVDVAMSRGFWPKKASMQELLLHKPQCMLFTTLLDDTMDILYDTCQTLG